jgi:hypothetical protein
MQNSRKQASVQYAKQKDKCIPGQLAGIIAQTHRSAQGEKSVTLPVKTAASYLPTRGFLIQNKT